MTGRFFAIAFFRLLFKLFNLFGIWCARFGACWRRRQIVSRQLRRNRVVINFVSRCDFDFSFNFDVNVNMNTDVEICNSHQHRSNTCKQKQRILPSSGKRVRS